MNENFKYINSFDGIRAIAVFSVMLLHGTYSYFSGGWIGVDLFFVLSGYLITSLLQNEFNSSGKISLKNFYIRRILKIIPPLIITILLSNILWKISQYLHPEENQKLATLAGLFYFTNLIVSSALGLLEHLWSLSVEEHFYLIWPLLTILYIFLISLRQKIVFLTILIIISTILRIVLFSLEQNHHELRFGYIVFDSNRFTFCRIDAILLGSLAALIPSNTYRKYIPNRPWLFAILFFFLILIIFQLSSQNLIWRYGGFLVTNFLCLSLIILATLNPLNPVLCNKILIWIGRRSYGIYMYHFPIFLTLESIRILHNSVNYLFVTILRFGLNFILAEISYRYVEIPILKYKKRLQSVN